MGSILVASCRGNRAGRMRGQLGEVTGGWHYRQSIDILEQHGSDAVRHQGRQKASSRTIPISTFHRLRQDTRCRTADHSVSVRIVEYNKALRCLKEEQRYWQTNTDTVSYSYIENHLESELAVYEESGDLR